MKVLVTGNRGYIGVHLVDLLQRAGYDVTGCDLDLFQGCSWDPCPSAHREWRRDFRELQPRDLAGHDVICHLAAISNDPMGDLAEDVTYAVNLRGTIELARRAQAAGVPRFLLASSCSSYGRGAGLDLTESAPLDPVSAYAKSKVEAEVAIRALAQPGFTVAFLRNATAFGDSPMMRIDLVANNLLACAWTTGRIRIMSDGTPWRPLIHCRDIARAFVAFAQAPAGMIAGLAVNVGANEENFQVRAIADEVKLLLPEAQIEYTGEVGHDPRNYRVNFDLLGQILPGFALEYNLRRGLTEMLASLRRHAFGPQDWSGDRFVRLRTLKNRLDRLRLAVPEHA